MTLKCVVYDTWWPWRVGVVSKVLKTGVHVTWSDGEVCRYDKAHLKFLKRLK